MTCVAVNISKYKNTLIFHKYFACFQSMRCNFSVVAHSLLEFTSYSLLIANSIVISYLLLILFLLISR